jgi:hypothetical protein
LAETSLRPRSGLEIIDAAFSLLKRHYVKFITIMGIGYLPYLAALMVFTRSFDEESMTGILGGVAGMIISMFWLTVINAAMILAASESYLGREIDIEGSLRQTMRRFGRILFAGFLKVMAIWVGLLFLLVGAIWSWVTFFAVPATCVIEDVDAMKGMSRSAELSRGHKGTIFGTLFITYLLFAFLMTLASLPAFFIQSEMIIQVFSAIATILIYPMVALVETLLYYDMRIRKEGFDIELMARELGDAPATQSLP